MQLEYLSWNLFSNQIKEVSVIFAAMQYTESLTMVVQSLRDNNWWTIQLKDDTNLKEKITSKISFILVADLRRVEVYTSINSRAVS